MTAPHDAIPLSPRRQHVLDGHDVTLHWSPSDGARLLRVQVARDPVFADTVIEEDLPPDATSLALSPLPTDDNTFYWRVLARGPGGWSEGERIESFISGRTDQVGRFADPDEAEPLGPAGPLLAHTSLLALTVALPGDQPEIDAELGEARPEGIEAAEVLTLDIGLGISALVLIASLLIVLVGAC